ncbi:MAG: macro domain-containing protein [Roseburia faecis]
MKKKPERQRLRPVIIFQQNIFFTPYGSIIQWEVTGKEEELLASCYRECLKLAADTGAESVAFCCLSTGVFRFPQQRAAEIATETVKNYINEDSRIKKSYLTYSRTMI